MSPKDTEAMGPCKVLSWQIDLEGDYISLARVLAWLENGPRLVRIDHMSVQLPNGKLTMQLVVRGLAMDRSGPGTVSAKGHAATHPATRPQARPRLNREAKRK